jgi:hypothetical protein
MNRMQLILEFQVLRSALAGNAVLGDFRLLLNTCMNVVNDIIGQNYLQI